MTGDVITGGVTVTSERTEQMTPGDTGDTGWDGEREAGSDEGKTCSTADTRESVLQR